MYIMYIYVYIYTYMYIYMYICIYIYVYIYMVLQVFFVCPWFSFDYPWNLESVFLLLVSSDSALTAFVARLFESFMADFGTNVWAHVFLPPRQVHCFAAWQPMAGLFAMAERCVQNHTLEQHLPSRSNVSTF